MALIQPRPRPAPVDKFTVKPRYNEIQRNREKNRYIQVSLKRFRYIEVEHEKIRYIEVFVSITNSHSAVLFRCTDRAASDDQVYVSVPHHVVRRGEEREETLQLGGLKMNYD